MPNNESDQKIKIPWKWKSSFTYSNIVINQFDLFLLKHKNLDKLINSIQCQYILTHKSTKAGQQNGTCWLFSQYLNTIFTNLAVK